jgi:hypothetical protein
MLASAFARPLVSDKMKIVIRVNKVDFDFNIVKLAENTSSQTGSS